MKPVTAQMVKQALGLACTTLLAAVLQAAVAPGWLWFMRSRAEVPMRESLVLKTASGRRVPSGGSRRRSWPS